MKAASRLIGAALKTKHDPSGRLESELSAEAYSVNASCGGELGLLCLYSVGTS